MLSRWGIKRGVGVWHTVLALALLGQAWSARVLRLAWGLSCYPKTNWDMSYHCFGAGFRDEGIRNGLFFGGVLFLGTAAALAEDGLIKRRREREKLNVI